ncbi:scavenger receptor class F member 1-like [Haliotis rufescens]|uniref:scavenger receptor class F member 1-like n=1 Tax=Haliotis rufescens TaxID=6454 RepID=UPI00201F4E46|nr:scavenger receptor class F member 1-like [Haliotis rufescens]
MCFITYLLFQNLISVNITAASVMVWIACLVIATEAGPCKKTNHCSDCDRDSGDCLTDCDTGYYDRYCNSTCSKNCRHNTCVTSSHGGANCTEGCVPGYQGFSCNIPCDSPGGGCTACPGGCDGGYCQLGSSCMSGCVDSYFGTDCDVGTVVGKVGLYTGLSAAAFGFIVMVVLVVCCKYRQRLRRNRFQQYVTPVQSTPVSADAIDAREYAVVDEAAMYDALTAGGQPASDGYEELRSVHRSDISRDLAHSYTTEPRTTSM